MAKRIQGVGGVVGAVVAATLGTAIGCGDGFASGDCHASRTCASAAGDGAVGGATDGNDTPAGGVDGSDPTPLGGAGSMAGAPDGQAGAGGVDSGCRTDAECSNDDAEDGEEICDNGECLAGNPPPTIVSFTPENDAVDVEPDTKIVIEFSEPLDVETVNNIQVLDGETPVAGTPTLDAANRKVTFTPDVPLALLGRYTLSVSTGVTDEEGASLVEELSATFQVRDGAWTTKEVVKNVQGMSDELPMTSTGSVLVSWAGSGATRCPATAGWFLRGQNKILKTFAVDEQLECNYISSGANAAGVAGVVWTSPQQGQGVTVEQYREDAWRADADVVSEDTYSTFQLAVAPSGVATLFERGSYGMRAWMTDVAGQWPSSGASLSAHPAPGRTSVAFNPDGKGLAVWRTESSAGLERIVASRLPTANGTWAQATDLPGSVTTTSSAAVERGEPVVALDSQGGGLALWVDASSSGKLMASRVVQSTWAQPEVVSGALVVDVLGDPPALVFDGEAFVAAWSAIDEGKRSAYTARYDLTTGWDDYHKQQSGNADGTSAARMPRLGSDGRGNLILVYASGTAPDFTLLYQRYTGEEWSAISLVQGGHMSAQYFETSSVPLPLSVSSNGLAALAWADYEDDTTNIASIHLASFY